MVKGRRWFSSGLGISDDPAEDIGAVVGNVLLMNLQNAQENKKTIPPRVVIQASMELSYLVAELAVQMGRMGEQDLNREAVEGFYEAIKTFGSGAREMLGEQAQEYSQIIDEVVQAEQKSQPQQQGNS